VKRNGGELELRFAGRSEDQPLRGLAVGEVEGKLAFFDVNMPWPSAEEIAAAAKPPEPPRRKQARSKR
jgi:hypothetical protein